jgi:diaminohydroxyphosphoribosylaminopyrimidine deaminase / 5-amino-6-(5-phosphoribosylamino)uracil reductase
MGEACRDARRRSPWSMTPGFSALSDDTFMDEAFQLAELGRGKTHPNPMVGAVLARGGDVVGRGWHLGPGRPHAEVMALQEAGDRAAGATLYCTLEPCCHFGRTPPCADAILAARVARAVIALRDLNPLVNGRGLERLRQGGVDVELREDSWGPRARRLNAAFIKYHCSGMPLVTYKAAVTLDGKVAASGGDARWISCLDSRRVVHRLRAQADAVMVGAGTVRRDDPELTVRLVQGRNPTRVVITRHGDLPATARVLDAARATPTIVIVEEASAAARRLLADRGVELVEVGEAGLRAGLAELAARGLFDVICEGGPVLAGALLAERLIDRVVLFVAPVIVGRGAPDLFAAPAVEQVGAAWRLRDVEWSPVGDDLMLTGSLSGSED